MVTTQVIGTLRVMKELGGLPADIVDKYRRPLETAAKKGQADFFGEVSRIFNIEPKSKEITFAELLDGIYKAFETDNRAYDKGKNINSDDFKNSTYFDLAANSYIQTANSQLAILTEIKTEADKASPNNGTVKSKIESLRPFLRTAEMNTFLKDGSGLDSLKSNLDPNQIIKTAFTKLDEVATITDGKYVRAKESDKNKQFQYSDSKGLNEIIAHLVEVDPENGNKIQTLVREFIFDKGSPPTDAPKPITASVEKLRTHLEGDGPKKVLTSEDITSLTACLSSTGEIDTAKLETLFNALADRKEGDKTISKADQQKAVFEAVKASTANKLKDATVENFIDKLKNPTDTPDGKGGWGETLLNIGKTALTSGVIVAAAIFFIVTGQLDKLKKLISGKADQQEVVQLAQQIMTTEQQQLAALTKEVISLKNNLKTETTNRTSGKKSQRKKPIPHRNNAPEGHETTRMNAPAKQATIRMKAPEDGVDGVPTDNGLPQDDQIDGAPTDNDLPSDDQIDGAPTENDLPSDDQVDNGLNDNDGNNQVVDEDGGDSAANSTIDGQPNSTCPMEGEGNYIVPKSKRVYISRGDGQPINVTKHAPAAVTTINFESDRYGNIPKKVTNKGGGDFDNE